ncbi:hypothetical protein TREMEDRAFT_43062 [Tremella mesenterica DSM 1558]|uniref:uncharacterized protein n=1 Tax=Tremella mesenterica (strain ATCC 24925 / CBS 8224 / DSM 1558 / NBRC 9311 / NRRL Y-6157 / RJB 2259-6 / UBC 559-6) TaxID=578456 RepID=UPI0003F49CA5|nr:uncharacterized protein TREMEDRAFT_43062 [Tremella mesenterica DSM 1558]EIW71793.1 hypothetical protein TREMEDRAFT_43062 [Tremella mesenterica DSM 1558]
MPGHISKGNIVQTQVHPLSAHPNLPSSSSQSSAQVGLASPALWQRLKALQDPSRLEDPQHSRPFPSSPSRIDVAIEWPEERRVGKGKQRALVVWIEEDETEHETNRLYLPLSLFPPYSNPPLVCRISHHHPISLSLVILQAIAPSQDTHYIPPTLTELDLKPLYTDEVSSISSAHRDLLIVDLLSQNDLPPERFRILMTEPVQQGIFTPTTRIIISPVPHVPDPTDGLWPEDDLASESSHGNTHLSMVNFDSDSFLSSGLTLSTSSPRDLVPFSDETDLAHSVTSSTSGSVTPRPPGTPRTPSPPVAAEDLIPYEAENGARFTAVNALGPAASYSVVDQMDVCWVGVSGLGRAGIFEGDWVLLKSITNTGPSSSRLVKALAWEKLDDHAEHGMRIVRRGDIISVPVRMGKPLPVSNGLQADQDETIDDFESDPDDWGSDGFDENTDIIQPKSPFKPFTGLVFFIVTSLSFEPLVSLEEDFSSSVSSKARAGELGCWVNVGKNGITRMVLNGVDRAGIQLRDIDRHWNGLSFMPTPYDAVNATTLRDLLSTGIYSLSKHRIPPSSVLIIGDRGAGKRSFVESIANHCGLSVIFVSPTLHLDACRADNQVECYDLVGDTFTFTEGTLAALLEKTKACAPSILLLHHLEALAQKSEAANTGRLTASAKLVEDASEFLRKASLETGWPCVLCGTTRDEDAVPAGILGCFKREIKLQAPNEEQRATVIRNALQDKEVAPDVDLKQLAIQTAALRPGDILSLTRRASDVAFDRAMKESHRSALEVRHAGVAVIAADMISSVNRAKKSYAERIDAPRIPNVSWDDVGGLASVKTDILDTIQLPLDHPELFAEGLKKRSGILLYGPPGTGKTLLAKAVATSLSLNFFSVKGPELLNMYIGESEANVRRVFQRARDAAPCVIFMDELDSVAPKRGNQGDSGGVMDRIVSQLLAELDGMSSGGKSDVFVMGATNRPDLLDPALLRPGRFDRMLYLGVPNSHQAQLSVLKALTRKFKLHPECDLEEVAERCPFNLTGADFYALCSDAMLRSMTRLAEEVDEKIERFNSEPPPYKFPYPMTPQYYLSTLAQPEEIQVQVTRDDFWHALEGLIPSVSEGEMEHYRRVQGEFQGYAIGNKSNGIA